MAQGMAGGVTQGDPNIESALKAGLWFQHLTAMSQIRRSKPGPRQVRFRNFRGGDRRPRSVDRRASFGLSSLVEEPSRVVSMPAATGRIPEAFNENTRVVSCLVCCVDPPLPVCACLYNLLTSAGR